LPQAVGSEQPDQPHQPYADDQALSALRGFAQQIEAEKPRPASAKDPDNPHSQFKDEAYLALWAYARQIGTAGPEPIEARPEPMAVQLKLADADNALDALREFLQKGSTPPPSPKSTPKVPAGVPKRSSAPIEATYVGAKVCLTCHASQAEAFDKDPHGQDRQDSTGKARLRELPRSGVGAREGRRRARCGRAHLVPAGRPVAYG
jgi:hypothetical protein